MRRVPLIGTCPARQRHTVSVSSPFSTLIDACCRKLPELVRSAVHYFNEESELAALAAGVRELSR